MALLDDIRALPAELLAGRDTAAIAAALSAGRVRLHERLISERGVLAALPVPAGDLFLKAIETFAATALPDGHPLAAYHGTIARGVGWLMGEGLDLGDPLTRTLLDTLAMAGVVESASVATIKALAEQPDPIDEMDVRRACWSDDGVWQA
ncbi:MAG: hypothetical protein QG638_550 [Pseudomonadota bacterium]|jgi:hypothetical protein|nr:hypothetical protein [Pseudomonadota bacterium]MDQ5904752.1 hypothetical protein [Pseudomonadota bacterium]MDQ5907407.1 hypothetical protein [Pseudomonadota bacterium]MDQ5942236.1 hypothetical protein [Pseudomonadota bacterium]